MKHSLGKFNTLHFRSCVDQNLWGTGLPTLYTFNRQLHEITTANAICLLHLGTKNSPQSKTEHVTHRFSCPHGTTSNKGFALVWNRGIKGQSLLMDFIPVSSR